MGKLTKVETGLFRTDTGRLIVDKMVNGQRIYRNLDAVPLPIARRIISKLVSDAVEAQLFPEKCQGSLTLTVRDCLNRFWTDRLQYLVSGRMEKHLLNRLDATIGDTLVRSLNVTTAETLKRELLVTPSRYGRPLGPRFVNMILQLLSRALNWSVKARVIPANPIRGYAPARETAPKKTILDEGYEGGPEWLALLDALPEDTKPIAVCLYETAMRPAEVFALKWEWITEAGLDRWLIVIPPGLEKTGAARKVPVSQRLLDVLGPMRQAEGLVFPSLVTGERRLNIAKAFRNAVTRASLDGKGLSPYCLRRTRITIWDQVDGDGCRYVVGHTFQDVHSRHYRAFTPERLFKLVGLPFDHREQFKLVAKVA